MTREEAREAIKEAYGNSEYTDEIIKALEQEQWIPFTIRNMDEEEKQHYINIDKLEIAEYGEIFNCPLPDDGEEVLVSKGDYVFTDIFVNDGDDGCYFEGTDIEDVEAWMPLPKSYKAESEDV